MTHGEIAHELQVSKASISLDMRYLRQQAKESIKEYVTEYLMNTELKFFSNARKRIETCMNYTRPELAIVLEPIRKAFLDAKRRSVDLRYITEITKDNISYCKELMTLVDEIRHLEGINGNFMLSETEFLSPIILFERGKVASQIVYSNLVQIVEQQQYFFDTLWNKAIPAKDEDRGISLSVTLKEHKNDGDNDKEVIASIKDAGIGIAPEIMSRLFTNFAAKSDKGTGLGLFISKNIVESHGGRIWAENNADSKGATFSFSLLLSKP
jgi:histidine kinase/DNA gyrase B/HSP90-like ATPase